MEGEGRRAGRGWRRWGEGERGRGRGWQVWEGVGPGVKIRSACGVAPRIVLRGRLQSGDAALKPVLAPPPPSPSPLAAALALTSPSLPLPHRSPSPPSRQFLIFRISRTTRRSLSSSTRARRSRLFLRPTLLAPTLLAQRSLPLVPLAPRLSPHAPRPSPLRAPASRTSPPSCRTTTVARPTPSSRSPPSRAPPRTSSSSSRGRTSTPKLGRRCSTPRTRKRSRRRSASTTKGVARVE